MPLKYINRINLYLQLKCVVFENIIHVTFGISSLIINLLLYKMNEKAPINFCILKFITEVYKCDEYLIASYDIIRGSRRNNRAFSALRIQLRNNLLKNNLLPYHLSIYFFKYAHTRTVHSCESHSHVHFIVIYYTIIRIYV